MSVAPGSAPAQYYHAAASDQQSAPSECPDPPVTTDLDIENRDRDDFSPSPDDIDLVDGEMDSFDPEMTSSQEDPKGDFDDPTIGQSGLGMEDPTTPASASKPPRQRRRRTSIEDQKILETEFQKNPKPDRQTRMHIVSRVALGEKEVQIWFQNRRQSCRRRSRLAEAAQSIQVQTGGVYPCAHPVDGNIALDSLNSQILPPEPDTPDAMDDWHASSQTSTTEPPCPTVEPEPTVEPANDTEFQPPALPENSSIVSNASSTPSSSDTDQVSSFCPPTLTPADSNVSTWSATTAQSNTTPLPMPPQDHSSKTNYLASRRSASFTSSQQNTTPTAHDQSLGHPTDPRFDRPALPMTYRRSVNLRLSTTADGKARVVDDTEPSPSPPSLSQMGSLSFSALRTPRSPIIRRAHSASVSAVMASPSPYARLAGTRRITRTTSQVSGRAHDSRAWDYCCDPDIRNSLVNKATMEASENARSRAASRLANFRDSVRAGLASTSVRSTIPTAESPSGFGPESRIRRQSPDRRVLDPVRSGMDSQTPPVRRKAAAGFRRSLTYSPYGLGHYVRAPTTTIAPYVEPLRQSLHQTPDRRPADPSLSRARSATVGAAPSTPQSTSHLGLTRAHPPAPSTPSSRPDPIRSRGDMDMDCVEGLLKLSQGRWR